MSEQNPVRTRSEAELRRIAKLGADELGWEATEEQVVAFARTNADETLHCVFNLSTDEADNPSRGGSLLLACGGADPTSGRLPPASGYIARC